MDTDKLISGWALSKFWAESFPEPGYEKERHLQICPTVTAVPMEMGWDCCCYSEYTRDDSFFTMFKIACGCDVIYSYSFYNYNTEWDLPEIIRELDEYRSNVSCQYWTWWD